MRVSIVVLIIAFLVLGAVFGALNPQVVAYDFGFARIEMSKGSAFLIALLIGARRRIELGRFRVDASTQTRAAGARRKSMTA